MKRYISLLILSVSILAFTGCGTTAPTPGSKEAPKPIAAVIPDDITVVNTIHIVGGQSTEFTVEGSNLNNLRTWAGDLQYKHKTFTKGNSPGDKDGGEVYNFELTEGDYPGFSYVINGEEDCYLLINSEWYSVSNPSDPPVDNNTPVISMVMVKGELYYDTGKESEVTGRCGVMDGEITSSVESSETPAEDDQSNFGTGFGYQFWGEGQIEILINNKWIVFEKQSGDNSPILQVEPSQLENIPKTENAPNNELVEGNLPVESPSIELDLVSAEYRARWKESYNYDTPILIDDLAALTDFLKNHPVQLSSVDTLQQNYNDEFFMHSVVYAYVESEGSGSIKLTAESAQLSGDTLKLFMERIVPEVGTADMAALVCLFGISRDDIKSIKSVEGIVECITLEEGY